MATTNNTKGTILYRKVARTPQTGENAGKTLYYATAVTDKEVSYEQFIAHVAGHGSPYSRGTILGLTSDILECLQELILDGKSVRLGDLGLFSLGISSRGETTAGKVSADSIQEVHLILRNTKSWSNKSLKDLCTFKAYKTRSSEEDEENGGGSQGSGTEGGGSSTGKGDSGSGTGGSSKDDENVGL